MEIEFSINPGKNFLTLNARRAWVGTSIYFSSLTAQRKLLSQNSEKKFLWTYWQYHRIIVKVKIISWKFFFKHFTLNGVYIFLNFGVNTFLYIESILMTKSITFEVPIFHDVTHHKDEVFNKNEILSELTLCSSFVPDQAQGVRRPGVGKGIPIPKFWKIDPNRNLKFLELGLGIPVWDPMRLGSQCRPLP